MWFRFSMLAVTVCQRSPILTSISTSGRFCRPVCDPDFTWTVPTIGPAPISAATSRSMLVRRAPVSDLAIASIVRPPAPTVTRSV